MNTFVRAVRPQRRVWDSLIIDSQKMTGVWVMLIILLVSALSIVVVKDLFRRSYLQTQVVEQAQLAAETTHNRLLLESATWLAQSRLASKAQAMGMQVPTEQQRVWLLPSKHNQY